MTDSVTTSNEEDNKLIAERRAKLAKLRALGNAFPNDFRRSAMSLLSSSFDVVTESVISRPNL